MTPRELFEATKTDNSVMPLIMSLDDSVRGLKNDLYDFKREVKDGMANMRMDIAVLNGEVKAMGERFDKKLIEVRSELKEDIIEIKGDIKSTNARIDALQVKIGWYLAAFGVIIALIQLLK